MPSTQIEPKKINIFSYSILTDYLKDYYLICKSKDSSFTYESWSYKLGFKGRSFMYLVTTGKRSLSADSAQVISKSLKLTEKENEHFLVMANVSKKENTSIKSIFEDKVLENLEFEEERINEENSEKLLSSPTMPLIRVLLSSKDIPGTKTNIKKYIHISEVDLEKDLSQLEQMKMVERYLNSEGEEIYKTVVTNFKIPEKVNEKAISFYHENVLNEARIVNKSTDIFKKLRSLMMFISPKDYDSIDEEIETFVNKIKNKYTTSEVKGKSLFRFNLQAYPIKEVSESEK